LKVLATPSYLGCLARCRETDCFAELVDSVLIGYRHDGTGNRGDYFEEKDKKMGPNIRQFLRKVTDEHFTVVVKVLGSLE